MGWFPQWNRVNTQKLFYILAGPTTLYIWSTGNNWPTGNDDSCTQPRQHFSHSPSQPCSTSSDKRCLVCETIFGQHWLGSGWKLRTTHGSRNSFNLWWITCKVEYFSLYNTGRSHLIFKLVQSSVYTKYMIYCLISIKVLLLTYVNLWKRLKLQY